MMDEVKTKKKLKAAENWFRMAENAKTPEKQIEYYTKSLDANPYNAEAWFRKGRTMEKMGLFNDAQRSFDHAIEIDPDYQRIIGQRTDTFEPSASTGRSPELSDVTTDSDLERGIGRDEDRVIEGMEKEDTGFAPPAREKSIFADLGPEQEEESVHKISSFDKEASKADLPVESSDEAEQEIKFAAVSGVKKEKEEMFLSDNNEEENAGTIIAPESDTSPVTDAQVQGKPAGKEEKKFVSETLAGSSYNESMKAFGTGTPDSIRTMDIRIPLKETLRFWLVGIVAIIIAAKILGI
ncbi:MAG: tetratricopeptide repeat protein [Methanosarcinaceae archaeon]|nr:tetratricopeptide repeat protein [Methanosarcinaceae archaeon]